MHVIYRVKQAGYVIRILVAVPQEYVNTYSTYRVAGWVGGLAHRKGGQWVSS